MKKTRKIDRPLRLNLETIRVLKTRELSEVPGGYKNSGMVTALCVSGDCETTQAPV
jgi:hypothetical protein